MLEQNNAWRIKSFQPLISPRILIENIPFSFSAKEKVTFARQETCDILQGRDKRLLVVVGPCSIHDIEAAKEYANRLKEIIPIFKASLHLIMRVYFEKPRTIMGWKGLINDPYLNHTYDVNHGLMISRQLLSDLTELGVPLATEFIDTFSPHYISDFITWGAIGARTVESRLHRELASALPMPIGFKNNTDGNVEVAINAIEASAHPHHFYSIDEHGRAVIFESCGNAYGHVVLRGSDKQTNYDLASVEKAVDLLNRKRLSPYLMIDCSHGNSHKKHQEQKQVAQVISKEIAKGNPYIAAVMIESFLEEGRQSFQSQTPLRYGQSITDACLSWDQTLPILEFLAESVEQRKKISV